jgi:ankyrin repeat protein
VTGGDRIEVDFTGRYASGEVWGEGPLTLIAGPGTYDGAGAPLRVGAVLTLQYIIDPNDTTVRLWPFTGEDGENEAYQVRTDRGQVFVEHTVRKVCRPLRLFVMQTGFGPIEAELGCWRTSGTTRLGGGNGPEGKIDPVVRARPAADTSRYLIEDGLHLAVRDGRPEIVGWLLSKGRDIAAADSFGFLPIHYAGWAQRTLERFVPALEQEYIDAIDTLLAHGASIDAPVLPAKPPATSMQAQEHEGQTVLGFAASECADRLVKFLLDRGARPDAAAKGDAPALTHAARNGCFETVGMLLEKGATVDLDPQGGGNSALERVIAVSAFNLGHLKSAELLVKAGARREIAAQRLKSRLDDPGPGGFGFYNRPMARRILKILK